LNQYSIVGDLTLHVTGHVPLNDAKATDLTFDASLQKASATVGSYQFPVDSADMKGTFRQMQLAWDPISMNAFDGTINSTGNVGFGDPRTFALHVTATDVLIQDLLRTESGAEPQFAGKVGLKLDLDGQRQNDDTTMKGGGTLTIADGKLINIPVVGAVADALNFIGKREEDDDQAEAEFTLTSDRVKLTKSAITSRSVAAHGTGDIHYDGQLDLMINAGVVEKVESLLGGLGDVLGALTDKLLPYKVTGTWSEPTVTAAPLGITLGEEK